MKEKRIVLNFISVMLFILAAAFMTYSVAAAVQHSVGVDSTVSYRAIGKVKATLTLSDTASNAVIVNKNGSEVPNANGSITIDATENSVVGSLGFGNTINLTAVNAAVTTLTYSYMVDITNNYLPEDTASYKNLKVTFTPPEADSCVSVTYDSNFAWTTQALSKVVTIEPGETARITVTFTTDASITNSAVMSSSFILENAQPEEWLGGAASTFAGGTGDPNDPYLIDNGEQLALMSYLVNYQGSKTTYTEQATVNNITTTVNVSGSRAFGSAYYKQTSNIYLNDGALIDEAGTYQAGNWLSWTPIGSYSVNFRGTYEGNSKIISGLYINTNSSYQGLFGYVYGARIQNLGVVNSYVAGSDYVGAVLGNAYPSGYLTNCYNSGTVKGSGGRIGGVCGGISTTLTSCYNTGVVVATGGYSVGGVAGEAQQLTNCYNIGSVQGREAVGGVVGVGNATNCYNTGNVTGTNTLVGGVGGMAYKIINCYNSGNVVGTSQVGGINGCMSYNSDVIKNSYNVGNVTGTGTYVGGVCGEGRGTASYCYYLEGCAKIGNTVQYGLGGTTEDTQNVTTKFDTSGTLSVSATFNDGASTTNVLLDALNMWITDTTYTSWIAGLLYPIFA